jgi:hypothetical protein
MSRVEGVARAAEERARQRETAARPRVAGPVDGVEVDVGPG